MDVATFADNDLLPFHRQPHPLPHHRLPLLHQLDAIVNRLPLAPDLYPQSLLHQPRLSLSIPHSRLVQDESTQEITSRRTLPTVFVISEQSLRNNNGGLLFSLLLLKHLKRRTTSSNDITDGSLTKAGTRCTGYIGCSGG